MDNKNKKIFIKSSLKLGKMNEINYRVLKMQPNIGQINNEFEADYVLNVDLGLLENFVNFNQFFNIATYDQNNIVQLDINTEFINNALFTSSSFVKFDDIDANPYVVNNPIYLKLNTNNTNLNYRFLEILSTKIFGDPTLKDLILNQEPFYEVIDGINSVLTDTSTTTEILNTYSELPVYEIPTTETNFNFRNTVWDFPLNLSGHILDTLGVENNTFNGPNMGGSIITNGIYNIPIILRFYGVSTRKIVVGGRGKNPKNILAYSYDAFDWINATLPELNKDYFRQINTCLYIPNLWLAGGLAFNDGSNNIMTSTDGITWNYNESENVVSNVMSLATNDTILVARYIIGALNTNGTIDSPNTVLYSYNNKDWFNSPSGSELFSLGLLNVKYNGSIWVGVGVGTTGGIIGYSLDGTEWTKSTSGSKNLDMYAYDIVWNGTIWVAVGRGDSSIIYSSDGINWSISTSGTNLLNPCSAITWDGIKFIAGGDSIIYSSNGIEWTASNTTLFSSINNIYSKVVISPLSTIVIASGTISNDLEQAQLAYSTDNGVTWTETINTISNEQAVTSTYWNGTYWLGSVISNNDETIIIYSDDGITWENTNTDIFSPNGYCSNLSWNGLQWTAVGFNLTDNLVFTSKDGYNWILSSASSLIVSGRCTSYANILPKIIKRETSDLIVASGSGNFDLMIGVDGLYWYGINLFFQTNSVIWIGNKWICGGPDGFGYSDDGLNWLPNNTIPFIVGTVNVIQWNGFIVVAGTNNGACSILYSFDGITWFPSFQINSILEPSYGIYSLTWANNKWVAGTINPRIQILSVIDPNSYDFNYGNDCTKTIDNDFTTSWDPISGYNLYQLVFTFNNDTKINCLNCFCSAVDNTDNLITGIQIEYLDSNSNYQSILNTTLSISDFTIKESLHLFEANFDLVLTNSIRISFQKSTPYQIFITEVQFFEIINSILYSIDGINWSSSNSSKGKFKEKVNSIIWDGNEIVATSNSLNEDNESILNYSNDLVNWTAPSSISNIFIANTSLSTDYRGYYNFINRELIVPLSFNVYITDLNKQEISYTFNNSIDYYNVQYVDSDAFTLLGDLSSNLVTIESTINLTNEHSYWGILSGIKDNYVNSIYFKFWSFNYTDLSVTVVDSSSNYVYTFSFSVGNLGFDNQINKSMGIGIIDISNTLIHTFPIPISNNNYFETTIDFLDTDLEVYLTNNTTYSFCVIGEFYQPDFSTLYTIRTTSNSTFLFTSSTIINPDIDPLSIKSLSLWLDGSDPNGDGTSITDSSTINIWYDKSGYNRNAIAQNFPSSSVAIIKNNIRNSLPIIRCNGTQRYFVNYPSFPNTNYTIFTVQLCNADNLRGYQRLVSGSSHDFSIFVGVKGTNIGTFTGSANESWNDTNENSPSIDNMGSWKIVSVVVDNSVLTPYVNGTAQNTKVGTTQPFNNLYIGGANLGMDDLQYWNGDIADIMIFNETLSQIDRQKIEGYLAWKWGLQSDLPNDHLYEQSFNPLVSSLSANLQPNLQNFIPHNNLPPVILLKAINYSGSGNWNDESGNGKNATLLTGTIAKNTEGNGIILDGSTAWTFQNVAVGNAWSVNVWFKLTSNPDGTWPGIVTQLLSNNQGNLMIGGNNSPMAVSFFNSGWFGGGGFNLTVDEWVNIQNTWDGTNMITYINGISLGATTPGGTAVDSGQAYLIGRDWNNDAFINGEIGEVRIYNYALTQEEVTTDYQSSYNDFNINTDINIDPNSLSFVKLYINSKDIDNMELEDNQIISITNKTNILTASTLRPIYSNHSILFNQSNCYLTLDGSIINNATSYCMFFAFKINSLTNPTILFYKQHDFQSTLSVKIVDGIINFHFNDENTNWDTYSNITVSINTIYILTIIWNGTNLVFRINGSLDSSNIGGNFNIPDDSSPTFTRIGSGSAWNLYDFIYCDSLISLENINILEGFLAWKWNLQVNLPFNHEYKKRIPLNTDILPFKPTSLSNLNLWLDAGDITTIDLSDNVITHWYDKSGFGNNGIAINNPIYDASSNSIRLDGSSNYIATTYTSFSPNETAFIVFNSNSTSQQALIDTNSIEGRAYQIVELGPSIANSGVNWLIYSSIPSAPNTTYIGEYNYNSNGMNLTLNGTPAGSNNTNPNFSDGITTIGSGYSGTMWYFSGTISEVIIYNTVLSQEDSQKVEGYLAWKWGLVSSLPSDHPYKNTLINPLIPNDFSPYSSDSVNTWLDGSDLSNMFADISLNTVITNNNQKIALWRDKSPNTYYFKQSTNNLAPTIKLNSLTNLPLVTFNNNILKSYPMPFFTSANSGGTFFFVFDSNSSSATTLLGYQNQTKGTFNNSETFIGYSFNNRINRFGFSRNGGMSTNTNNITIDSSYNLISSVMKNSGGSPSNILINKNGNSETVSNISSGYYSAGSYPYQNNSVAVTIGGAHVRDISENLLQSGNIAEIIWFNYPLTSSEIQKIEGYLAWKWSLQSNLPSSHPFYSGSPTLQLKYSNFSPLAIEGINLWLDAKDLWKDKSGKGLIVTAHGSPILTEDNLFSFNGTNQYFSIPYSGDHSTETGFVIIKFNNTDGEQDIICGDNGGRQYHNYNGDIRIASAGVTGSITNPTTPPEVSTLALLEYTITPTEINLYQNGTLLSTSSVSVTMGTESFINIGVNFALSSNTYFNGYIGEVILFNSVLSEIDRNKIEGYLAWKWGIEYNLPNDHPYYNYKTPPQPLPLPDQNVNVSITLSNYTPHINDSVIFTAQINGIYKFVSSTWTLNSTIVSKNTGSFTTTFNQEINYTIEFTLVTVNNTYIASYSLYIIANLPSQLPNLKVWLDGTDNKTITLDSWTDKSTNAYLFTGSNTAPSRTNLSFHFYERNNYFSYDPIVFNNANTYTFMMIAEFGNLRQFLGLNSEIVLGIGRPGLIEPGLNQPPARPGILYWNTHTQGSLANSIIPLQRNKKYIIIITYDGNNLIFKINGQIYSTTSGDFKIIDDLGVNLPWLGNWSFYNTINDWKLYDFIYTNSVTSMIEIIKMEGYFADKWNLQSDLPSDHPYKLTIPESISFNSFSPNSFSGLKLWLDASYTSSITLSDNNVTIWSDRRNNGISAISGTSPTYNSTNKSIQFDSSQTQYLNLPDGTIPSGNSAYSIFIVISTSIDPSIPQWFISGGSNEFILGSHFSSSTIANSWGYQSELYANININANQIYIVELFYNQTTRSIYFNGSLIVSDVPGVRNNNIYNNKIGDGSFGQPLNGNIFEIIIYNKQVTTDERVQIEGYLAWKWNLQSYLPNNHNFKNVSPNDLDLNVTTSLSVDNENPILGDTVNLTITKSGYYPLVSENWILNGNIVASDTSSYSQTYSTEGPYLLSYNLNTVNGNYTQEFNKII